MDPAVMLGIGIAGLGFTYVLHTFRSKNTYWHIGSSWAVSIALLIAGVAKLM